MFIFTFGRHHSADYGNVEPAQTSEDDQNPAQNKLKKKDKKPLSAQILQGSEMYKTYSYTVKKD